MFANMAQEREQELAHVLLTELLAYQFAMPVRWSETQTSVFGQLNVERFIEVGPSTILLGMAKKTLNQFHVESDAINALDRSLLAISTNYEDICYGSSVPISTPTPVKDQEQRVDTAVPVVPAVKPASSPETIDLPPIMSMGSIATISDAPIPTFDAVKGLVAGSLKKPISAIGTGDTLKSLSAGRSTMQNEIIGDMLREFGNLPDDVENIPLGDLTSIIEKTYDGKLGACLRTRLEKMMASKMPGSVDLISIRSHLKDNWSLESGRQDAVLLLGMSEQPAARLTEASEAFSFLDGIAQKYYDSNRLVKPSRGESNGADSQVVFFDPKAKAQLSAELDDLKKKIASLLLSGKENDKAIDSSSLQTSSTARDVNMLDVCESELGEDFCNGIQPIFSADQQRVYDSGWNWAHVDLLNLYYRSIKLPFGVSEPSLQDLAAMGKIFRYRHSPRLEIVKKYLFNNPSSRTYSATEKLEEITKHMNIQYELENSDVSDHAGSETGTSESSHALDENLTCSSTSSTWDSAPDYVSVSLSSSNKRSLRILQKAGSSWVPEVDLSKRLNDNFSLLPGELSGKDVLITGAGPNSIGISMIPSLLRVGARVVVTTTRPMPDAGPIYQEIFANHGGNGSQLVVVPFNQGSKQDIQNLVSHIYDPVKGLGWDLDFILPLAAVPEKGREIDNIDSKSELAHRAMLTNILRLLGAVKQCKESRGFNTRPAQVLLPLSPNQGTFGNDGLYSESKMGLLAVINKWSSENWSDYLSVCGVIIGWTRGTGLMAGNDDVANHIESMGFKTFSVQEMADNILKLMAEPFVSACQNQCLMANLSGGMNSDPGLAASLAKIRLAMRHDQEVQRAISRSMALDDEVMQSLNVLSSAPISTPEQMAPLVDLELGFPAVPEYDTEIEPLNSKLHGMVDLESVVVVVGYSELGPWGNARTRWDMEMDGELSIQGCIELAWMTGLIAHNPDPSPSGDGVVFAWIDVASGSPVQECEVKSKYEQRILEHAGLRLIEPGQLDHSSRDKIQALQEVMLQEDLAPFIASHEASQDFAREHGKYAQIEPIPGTDQFSISLRKGAVIMIPKATVYDRIVGGQLPKNWDPMVYGLPQEICESIDRCTLMALVCTAEALLSAGITDAYEFFKTIDPSELANCVGSGIGGSDSLQRMFRERFLDREVQSDILAETFINTAGAWMNMLLLGSNGPTRTPVGACATALESLNQGYDLITNGSAKVCVVGGFDGMIQSTSAEFAKMNATNNSAADLRRGRSPRETSRPCASSRAGFVESEGCGIQIITSAKVALDLGLPIRSVVAHVQTASDGVGRSVPAPGKGLMANVREMSANGPPPPLLDIDYRKQLLQQTLAGVRIQRSSCLQLHDQAAPVCDEEAEQAAIREEKDARRRFGNLFWTHDRRISPLRGALAVWGLTVDDIGVVSLHGTSTEMNEKNEVEVLHRQFEQLGRTPGNAALAVCQKYLTGHPKGAAAAWMLNGCCQMMETGIVPGNRNADNIDAALEKWHYLVFPNRSMPVHNVKAFSVTSFGFGQKGAQALGVHPKYMFATLDKDQFEKYNSIRQERYRKAKQYFQNIFYGGKLIVLKDKPPVLTTNGAQRKVD